MKNTRRELLEVLRAEFRFLDAGGYRGSRDWRPHFIFEELPTCMNYRAPSQDRLPCANCLLMALTPADKRSARVPCSHIPLNASGETLDTLYRSADQPEIELVVGHWLRTEIARLEKREAEAAKTTAILQTASAK